MFNKKIFNDISINDLNKIIFKLKKKKNDKYNHFLIDILRKFISLHSKRLKKKLKKNFNNLSEIYLGKLILIFNTLLKDKKFFKKKNILDIAIVNSMYSLSYFLPNPNIFKERLNKQLNILKKFLISFNINKNYKNQDYLLRSFVLSKNVLAKEAKSASSVVIFSPSPYSLYTVIVVYLCNYFNIKIEAIVIRKFSFKRFIEESRRDGYIKLLLKIFHKLILKGNDNLSKSDVSLKYVFEKLNIKNKNIIKFTKDRQIKIFYVNNYKNLDPGLVSLKSKIGLFTGGGIISENIIKLFKDGIINLHVGNLPEYRGMDTIEATILEGNFNSATLTTHFMENKVDTGPILSKFVFNTDGYKKIGILFNEVSAIFPFMIFDSFLGFSSGRYKKIKQNNHGKQHFVLNIELKKLVNFILIHRSKKKNKPDLIKNFVNDILKSFK